MDGIGFMVSVEFCLPTHRFFANIFYIRLQPLLVSYISTTNFFFDRIYLFEDVVVSYDHVTNDFCLQPFH